jgi:WXG100 family type VII secretion target
MADVIKLNYPAMREMAAHCRKVAQRLQETIKLGQGIASQMDNGALIGEAGQNFSQALREGFVPGVNKLMLKFEEVAKDIEKAITDMQAEDSEAGGRFTKGH